MDLEEKIKLCKEKGCIAFGYFSPELSSSCEYPPYIEEEVKSCVERIQEHQGYNTVTFGFMPDIHYSDTHNHNVRMKRVVNAYKEIAKRTGSSMLVLGGDYVNDGVKEYKVNNYRELRAHLSGTNFFPINGNHDDNSIWDVFTRNEKATQHIKTEELYSLFYSHVKYQGAEHDKNNNGLYYLYNDENAKIRYIFLDSNDIPEEYDENGMLAYTKQGTFALSQKQTDWLCNTALSFDEEGWGVVIFAHSAKFPGEEPDNFENNIAFLNEIIKAYKSGEDLNGEFNEGILKVKINAQFSGKTRGNIIALFAGHHHSDILKTDSYGVPFIYRANTIMYKGPKLVRTDGDATEILFDVITINKDAGKIYITRVGAGEDLEVSFK